MLLVFLFAVDKWKEGLVGAVVMAAGLTHFLYAQHHQDVTLFSEFFKDFNQRYDKLNNDLNAIRRRAKKAESLGQRAELQEDDLLKLYDYFNLCAEEYLFHEAGYIDNDVWRSWCRGMVLFDDVEEIHRLWVEETSTGSYYGFSLERIRADAALPQIA